MNNCMKNKLNLFKILLYDYVLATNLEYKFYPLLIKGKHTNSKLVMQELRVTKNK